MSETRHLVLVGLMGSGKSTVGRVLASRWGRPFVDNDEALEARAGRSAREIAATDGASGLHRLEVEVLLGALASTEPAVIAAAAAAPEVPEAASALRRHDVVYLRAPSDLLAERVTRAAAGDDHRPFVAGDARTVLAAQFAARDASYRALAVLTVDVSASDPAAVVAQISAALAT